MQTIFNYHNSQSSFQNYSGYFKEYVVNMGFFCRYPDTHLMNMFPDMDRVLTG